MRESIFKSNRAKHSTPVVEDHLRRKRALFNALEAFTADELVNLIDHHFYFTEIVECALDVLQCKLPATQYQHFVNQLV